MPLLNIFTSDKKIITDNSLEEVLFASTFNHDQQLGDAVLKKGLHFRELLFGNKSLTVISLFKFYKNIKKAISPTSGAYYLLWHEEEVENSKNGFLLQYLPPNSVTSKHYHKEQTEIFSLLEGKMILDTSESQSSLNVGDNYVVNPNVIHQLRTSHEPSLTVIEIKNVNYKDHHLVE